jgi:hypothetical protein
VAKTAGNVLRREGLMGRRARACGTAATLESAPLVGDAWGVNEAARPQLARRSYTEESIGRIRHRLERAAPATVNDLRQVRASLSRATVVAIWVLIAYGLLVVGAILLVTVIVGSCAALGVLLYGVARLCVHLFGFSFRWGLVTACGLLSLVALWAA